MTNGSVYPGGGVGQGVRYSTRELTLSQQVISFADSRSKIPLEHELLLFRSTTFFLRPCAI